MRSRLLLGLCLLLVGAAPALAQPEARAGTGPRARRPRLGLVLSGGGARGAAHVGVLKVLEELHVPVDLIAGTSMGSVVGGLYATGMSPQELEDLLAMTDWGDALDDDVPRAELPIRRKEERSLFLVGLSLGIRKGKVGLPSGLVAGQKLNFILRRETLPAALVDDFDRLPIPFRAVGTDAVTGHRVVLRKGSLPDAIRASMAFPALFAPVEIDGTLLVDGGVAENVPVETARAAGAEVLIAVDIGSPAFAKDELGDILKILGQVTFLATSLNVERSHAELRPGDVLIEPQLGGMSIIDFEKAREAVALGETAARAAADRLRAFAVSDAEWSAWLERTRRKPQPPLNVGRVEVVNTSPLADDVILERVRSRSGPLDLETLGADLTRLYALQQFDLVDFRILERGGEIVLQIVTKDRAWGHTRLRLNVEAETDLNGDSSFQLDLGVIGTSVNRLGGEFRLMGGLGATEWISGEVYQPVVASGRLFLSPHAYWRTDRVDVPVLGESVFVDYRRREVAAGLDAGLALDPLAELRVGVRRGYVWADPRVGSAVPELRLDRGSVLLRALLDSRDDESFPRRGAVVAARMWWESRALGARESFRRLEGTGLVAFGRGKSILQLVAQAGSPLGSELPYFDQFGLGGFRHLSGYRPNELYGPCFLFGSATYLRELGRLLPIIGGGFYAGLGVEGGNVWQDAADSSLSDLKGSVTVFVGSNSLVGPINVGVGLAGGSRWVVSFTLGRVLL